VVFTGFLVFIAAVRDGLEEEFVSNFERTVFPGGSMAWVIIWIGFHEGLFVLAVVTAFLVIDSVLCSGLPCGGKGFLKGCDPIVDIGFRGICADIGGHPIVAWLTGFTAELEKVRRVSSDRINSGAVTVQDHRKDKVPVSLMLRAEGVDHIFESAVKVLDFAITAGISGGSRLVINQEEFIDSTGELVDVLCASICNQESGTAMAAKDFIDKGLDNNILVLTLQWNSFCIVGACAFGNHDVLISAFGLGQAGD
jgi:hypothetical protein